jgi:KDO2-lipid IV(A) lauroyltransferase
MLFFRIFASLPLSFLYAVSDFIFLLSYYIFKYRRKVVRNNLLKSFPEKTIIEIIEIEKEFYHNLGDYAAETLKLLTISQEELGKRVVYKNVDILKGYELKSQSVLLLASHQFNWEWLVASGNFALPYAIDFVYQPIENSATEKFLLACRSRFGAFPIKRNNVAREIVKRRHLLRGIAIVADQYPGKKRDKKFIIDFLHQQTAFFYGANQLATLTQYPVLFAATRKVKRGFYEVTLMPIAEPPYEKDSSAIIEKYAKAAELVIREYPAGWLWSHKRWKKRHLKQASAKYPPASTAS